MFSLLITPAILAFTISLIATKATITLYHRLNLLDDPKKNSHAKVTHKHPVPRGGGVPIFLSLLAVGGIILGFDKHFLGITAGAFILTVTGILDDIFDLSPYLRLATGTLAALIVIAAGIGIAYITSPFEAGAVINLSQPQIPIYLLGKTRTIWVIADLFALVWIVWTMNIVNWSKGVDGQMPGFVVIAATIIGFISLKFSPDITQWPVTQLAAITAGAYLGFLFFNFYPQKIMPGYGGGSLAGFLLAILAILSGAKVAALILVLAIPFMDAIYTIIRRILQGKSPVWGDRGHLHHRLLDLGWNKPKVALFYWFATAFLGILALYLNSTQKLFTILATALIIGGLILWLKLYSSQFKSHD